MPTDPLRDASDAIRGYVHQFLKVVDWLLADSDAVVYVETFEDLFILTQEYRVAQQIKSRTGTVSITTRRMAEMLDRWASLAGSDDAALFIFTSTQGPGNLHDGSDAFCRWVRGEQPDEAIAQIRRSLSSYLANPLRGSSPSAATLRALVNDEASFERFFVRITWQLSTGDLSNLLDNLIHRIAALPGNDPQAARHLLNGWLGKIILSATSGETNEKRWTIERLRLQDTSQLAALIAQFTSALDHSHDDEIRKLLTDVNDHLHQLRNARHSSIAEHIVDFELQKRPCIGREDILSEIEAIPSSYQCAYFILEGDAGFGKTTIGEEFARRTGAAAYYLSIRHGRTRAAPCLRHLAASLVLRFALPYDHLPDRNGDDVSVLMQVLSDAVEYSNFPIWIVIDGIDEAEISRGANPLLLPERLPAGAYVLLLHRPGAPALALAAGMPVVRRRLRGEDPAQLAAVREYVTSRLAEEPVFLKFRDQWDLNAISSKIVAASEGNFMFTAYALEDLAANGDPSVLEEGLPQGLDGYYEQFIALMEGERDKHGWADWRTLYVPVLGLLAVAREPVTTAWLASVLDGDELEIRERVVTPWRRFLRRSGHDGAWQVIHQSFSDYLISSNRLDPSKPHTRICEFYLDRLSKKRDLDEYAHRHLVEHLILADRKHRLLSLIESPGWQQGQMAVDATGILDLRNVEVALAALQDLDDAAIMESRAAPFLTEEVLLCLERARIHEHASSVPPRLVVELVMMQRWSVRQALALSRTYEDPALARSLLTFLAPLLEADELQEALVASKAIKYTLERVCTLSVLARFREGIEQEHLIEEILAQALSCPPTEVSEAFAWIGDLLPPSLWRRAVAGALAIKRKDIGAALISLMMHASGHERSEIVEHLERLAAELTIDWQRFRVIRAILPEVNGEARARWLRTAFEITDRMREFDRIERRIQLLRALPDEMQRRLIEELYETISTSSSWHVSEHLGLAIAPWLDEERCSEIVDRISATAFPHSFKLTVVDELLSRGRIDIAYRLSKKLNSPSKMIEAARRMAPPERETATAEIIARSMGTSAWQRMAGVHVLDLVPKEQRARLVDQFLSWTTRPTNALPGRLLATFAQYLEEDEQTRVAHAVVKCSNEIADLASIGLVKRFLSQEQLQRLVADALGLISDQRRMRDVIRDAVWVLDLDPAALMLEHLHRFTDAVERTAAICAFLPRLAPPRREEVARELRATVPRDPVWYRIAVLIELLKWLPSGEHKGILAEIEAANSDAETSDDVAAARVNVLVFREAADEALAAARTIEGPGKRIDALLAVASVLEGQLLVDVIAEAVRSAEQIEYEPVRRKEGMSIRMIANPIAWTHGLVQAIARLPADAQVKLFERVWQLVERSPNGDERAQCFSILLELAPLAERARCVREGIEAALDAEFDHDKIEAFEALTRHLGYLLPKEQYEVFQGTLRAFSRSSIEVFLRGLAALVPLLEAIGTASAVRSVYRELTLRCSGTASAQAPAGR